MAIFNSYVKLPEGTHEPSTKKNAKRRQTIEDLRSNDAPAA